MSKKPKSSKHKKSSNMSMSQADKLFGFASMQMLKGDYAGAVTNYERILKFLPLHSPMRVDVLAQLGAAYAMLQDYPKSYAVLTQALDLAPDDADLWYNRGLAARFTMRFGRSFKDFKRAVELNKTPEMSRRFEKELKFSRKMAEKSIKLRGRNFTLDQLIEQEDLFQRGLALMEKGQWSEAEQAFRASIALGDCLPQPWGNVGMCLIMQERYDEAEAALKRALAIDPKYTVAKNNLALLPETRRNGPPKIFAIQDPIAGKVKQSITFIKE